jgi:fatty acid desaturase
LGADLIGVLDDLCCPPRFSGALFFLADIAAIAATATVAYVAATPFFNVLAVVYIGIRQRYLSNLTHECAHLKLLRSKTGNRLLGHVAAILLIQSFADYQDEHREHHALLGKGGDPKLASYAAKGAITPRRDKWQFVLRVIIANAVWTLPAHTIRAWFTKRQAESYRIFASRATFWMLALALAAWEHAELVVVWYWLVPLFMVRPAVHWVTDLANHAGLLDNSDPICQTRGWTSHVLARHVLGGHLDDMYHPIHHWAPRIPFHMLPRAVRIVQDGYPRASELIWCSGFFFRRRRTPDIPCVIEDIVTRLRQRPVRSEN